MLRPLGSLLLALMTVPTIVRAADEKPDVSQKPGAKAGAASNEQDRAEINRKKEEILRKQKEAAQGDKAKLVNVEKGAMQKMLELPKSLQASITPEQKEQ